MEFAEWAVSGLDQLRIGQLPGGDGLYQTVSAGLGGDPVLNAFMNSGDPAARAQLVQRIAQTAETNPGFEQQLRAAAAAAAPGGGTPDKPPFLKTRNGMVVLVLAVLVVVGAGTGLAVGLSGSGGGTKTGGSGGGTSGTSTGGGDSALVRALKGTWTCTAAGAGGGTITIGDGTWSTGGDAGTWKQTGGTATISSKTNPGNDITATDVPSAPGAFDILASGAGTGSSSSQAAHLKGTVSAHQLAVTITVPGSDLSPSVSCTK